MTVRTVPARTGPTHKILRIATSAGALAFGLLVLRGLLHTFEGTDRPGPSCTRTAGPARVHPDIAGVTIPPNIAPLNFWIAEKGQRYWVRISADDGEPIEVSTRTPNIVIPAGPWHRLLERNRGGTLRFDVFVQSRPATTSNGGASAWSQFETIVNTIAKEDIDDFLIYRRIRPAHSTWRQMGIYQRDLRTFAEKVVLDNGHFRGGCVNCHTFCNHGTGKMLLGIRSEVYGNAELLIEDGRVSKLGTVFGYTSWHPSGRRAAFSVNKVRQVFHAAANEVRDVLDLDSLMVCYDADRRAVTTAPPLARKDRLETYPTWSPDGRYLYFCSAPITWENRSSIPREFDRIRYSLVRVSYDIDSDTWGEIETVVSAEQTGQSALLPRISPDGRWLLFVLCDYGCFPVYRPNSDLYLIDLQAARQTGRYEYRRLDINSDASESWHGFSSNGRWIAFSSKRDSHIFTRTYLAYLDEQGQVHKPTVLPQKDPRYYESCLWTFSVPELVTEPVRLRAEALGRVIRRGRQISLPMPATMATPKAEAAPVPDEPWQHGHE
jgi:hypothetical protein